MTIRTPVNGEWPDIYRMSLDEAITHIDPSMSALPITETQKSQSVGLFTRQ